MFSKIHMTFSGCLRSPYGHPTGLVVAVKIILMIQPEPCKDRSCQQSQITSKNRVQSPSASSRIERIIFLKTYRGYDYPSRDSTLIFNRIFIPRSMPFISVCVAVLGKVKSLHVNFVYILPKTK